ncbi:VIT family-domain-containing protein, partial [Blyttiomyces helicus]
MTGKLAKGDHADATFHNVIHIDGDLVDSEAPANEPAARARSISNSHKEPHFGGAEIVRDVIVGLSDGLTVPFALAAGLSTLKNSRLVVTAGFAEIIAGAISMGLGGFLAGMSEIEHYDSERAREVREVETVPEMEEAEIIEIFEPYGLSQENVQPLVDILKRDKDTWVDFMMKFELNLERPSPRRSWISALTIGTSYF